MAYDTIDLLAGSPVLYVGEGDTFTEQELPYFLNIFGYTRRSCQYGIDLSAYAGKVIRGWHFKASFTVGGSGSGSGRGCSLGLASGEWAGESKIMQREPSSRVYPTPNGLVELEDVFLPTRYPVTFIRPNGAPGSRDWRGVVLRISTGTGDSLTTTLSEATFEVAEIYVSDPPVLEVVGALPAELPVGEDTIVTLSLRYAEDDPVVGAQIYVYGNDVWDGFVTSEQLTWGEDDGLYQIRVRPNKPGYFTLYYRADFPPTLHDEFFYFQNDTYYSQITAQDQWSFTAEGGSEEEPSSCFWTDLVNVTQVCGEAPEPNDGFADFWLDVHNGHGSAYGKVAIYHIEGGEQSQYVCNSALYEALLTAESVRITGLAVMQNPPTNDAPDGWDTCEVPLEDGIVWTDVDHEMSLQDTWGDGYNVMYYWYNDDPERGGWHNVRVDVDGQVFYGVVFIGGGV